MTPVSYIVHRRTKKTGGRENMQRNQTEANKSGVHGIARALVDARLSGRALKAYPGTMPFSLEEAYSIQDAAIGMWPDEIAGWKVGRITGEEEQKLGAGRLAGPIFSSSIKAARDTVDMHVFPGGFVAVEGEVVIIVGEDAPADKTEWTTDEAAALIKTITAGVEVASSPFPGINDNGPLVTISDFGNNFGLIIGDEIPDWRSLNYTDWRCETIIDGVSVGRDTPANIPGGPIESLRFLLSNCAKRGIPLKKGMAVSTGAITGVHEARAGQTATVTFSGVAPIHCNLLGFAPARALASKLRNPA